MEPSMKPIELSFPVPKNPHAVLHTHLSIFQGCVMVHLTTAELGESAGINAPLGSFIYAMPDRTNPRSAISTPINTSGSSIDYATRLSKILAIKLQLPVYVGCSINFAGTTTEEEMEGLRKVVNEIVNTFNTANSR